MTVPVLRAFVKQNPEVQITVIARPFFKPFFEEISNVSFFAFDEKQRHKGFIGLLRFGSTRGQHPPCGGPLTQGAAFGMANT